MNWIGLFFIAGGLFSMAGAICDWEWFINSRKARPLVKLISRGGARIVYGVLGLALIVGGVLGMMGIIDMSK